MKKNILKTKSKTVTVTAKKNDYRKIQYGL